MMKQEMPQKGISLSDTLNKLTEIGYNKDFKIKDGCIYTDEDEKLEIEDIEVKAIYRFEGMTNPADSSILFALEGPDGYKGTLVDAYGTYGSPIDIEIIKKLRAAARF
jgi:hypothetical protein